MPSLAEKIFKPSARGKVWQVFLFILLLVFIGGLVDAGSYYNKGTDYIDRKTNGTIKLPKIKEIPFRLGLDLQGGSHLVYEANMSEIPDSGRSDALEGVRDVIERRVNVFGVSEPLVQTSLSGGKYRVIAELAGIKDVNEAIAMIGETPLLEFKEETQEIRELSEEEKNIMTEYNTEAEKRAEEVLGKLLSGGDFGALSKEYSDDQNTKEAGGDLGWITENEAPQIIVKIKDFEIGQISEDLVKEEQGYDILKLEDKRLRVNPFDENEVEKEVKASHLLLCHNAVENCENDLSKTQAYAKIKEIKEQATPENFSGLIKEHSTEPGADTRAGDLGWFAKGAMVKPFEDTVFEQETGTISYVVETQFGYHLIYKQAERNIYEYSVRRLFIRILTEKDIIGDQKEWKLTELTGKHLERAAVQFDPNDNTPIVALEFDSEGADLFADITERNVGKGLGIFLDGGSIVDINGDGIISPDEVYAPNVNEKITGGKAVINGNMNINEAKDLVRRLNAGALPVPIELVSQQTVGASLGKISLESSLKAGLIGLILVALFMIFYYRLLGIFAVISLAIYGVLVLAIFKLWPVTLTLSGMAGFILSIGMAVDANVLIFERLKEEIKSGRPLNMAIENSFTRAWPSIRDGNVSTLITCLILIWFSTGVVKGFAITLGLGILVSMFSAIVITKNIIRFLKPEWMEKRRWLIIHNS
ncbi:MAG: protein translocase subunit SecD [Patescibacteria group bacterium]|nr:protein translocase subunit SecD [Patescibacteria group bacterium]